MIGVHLAAWNGPVVDRRTPRFRPAMSIQTPDSAAARPAYGRLCILLATVLWSTNGLFAKSPVFSDWPSDSRGTMLALWRAAFAGLLLVPAIRNPQWDPRLVPMALCFTGMNVCFLQSMIRTTAANAIWLQSTAPLWVFVAALVLWRGSVRRHDLLPLVCGLLGVGTILWFELHASGAGLAHSGVLLGLASGVFYAGVIVFMRGLRAHNAVWLVALNHLVAAAILAPYCAGLGYAPSARQFLVLAAFGLFQMGIPYLLFARGLREVSSQEGAGIGLLEPVISPVWVYLAHGERPAWWTMVGGVLILTGLVVRYGGAAAHRFKKPGESA